MNREQAYNALKEGKKISHNYFSSDEYYQMVDGKIKAEDNVNHTQMFWSTDSNNWREDGWFIKE